MPIKNVLKSTIKLVLQVAIICSPILTFADDHDTSDKDMSGMDMSGMDMSGMDMSGMDMSGMDMSGGDGHPMHMLMKSMPDAPIGIMGHMIHMKGGFMMSYSYMSMNMDGNRTGTNRVADDLRPGFRVSPLDMTMEMNMLGGMYGYSDNITLMAMIPVTNVNKMNLRVNMNQREFKAESSGVGDLKLSALIRGGTDFVFKVGLSVPTGSIDEKGVNPRSAPRAVQLPYPMQLGSGSFELSFGGVYARKIGKITVASKSDFNLVLNDNDNNYRVGNRIELSSWVDYKVQKDTGISVRFKFSDWGNISGADPALAGGLALTPPLVPTADPTLRGGTRLDMLFGIKYGGMHGGIIGLEAGFPIYQNLDGPQLEIDFILQAGLQYGF